MESRHESSLKTLQDIRSIMERSVRFISLSGWSGVWAGVTGLAGAYVARVWLNKLPAGYYNPYRPAAGEMNGDAYNAVVTRFFLLAAIVFIVALVGAYYFTWRKTRAQGGSVWNAASRRLIAQIAIPMLAGGIFALKFLFDGQEVFIAPTLLTFYGLALINGSKYTLSDIKYLGICEVVLGCICLFIPGYGLSFWAIGFGVLHIVYGIIMWNKYDKHISRENA
ncbi:hypothetical protein [Polluticoccus soli]|uniref:hypothetical protein n=1 Tax=Polluticoccus soli TaxID=3034150 RepID=UPI0023E0FB45|nr:hypothetical protein [Flavipsychrobacter sp. JY13-12]